MAISDSSAIMILGESISSWLQTFAIVVSALCAAAIIFHNGRTARRRATIDLIISQQKDSEFNKHYQVINKLINQDKTDLVCYAKSLDFEKSDTDESKNTTGVDELTSIRFVLNRIEFIAQGIRKKAFEERIYKDLNYTNINHLWTAVHPLITEIRRKKNCKTYYQEIEWLYGKWEKKPIKQIKK